MTTTAVEKAAPKAMPEHLVRRGIDESQWRTLCSSLYPGAHPDSVLMVVDYCRARKLDPLKKPCHIVPMKVKDAKSGNWEWRDVVMPGIYEYRTTAMRTGLYLGHSRPEYGPEIEVAGTKAPAWCEMTFFRALSHADLGVRIEFPVRVYFTEVVALKDGKPNDRWAKAPIQMLSKCCEAAGLREAFPDEFGGESTFEEMDGQVVKVEPAVLPVQAGARKSAQAAAITEGAVVPGAAGNDAPAAAAPAEDLTTLTLAQAAERVPVGTIARLQRKGTGAFLQLSSGFVAQSIDADLIAGAEAAQARGARVELITRPPSDPTKFAPTLEEIVPIGEEAGE